MASNKLLRVTQLDAVYLDKEIFKMMLQILQDITSYLPPKFAAMYTTERDLLLKGLILYYSIMKEGSTFGQQLLAIKYSDMTHMQRILYSTFSCLDYIPRLDIISQFPSIHKIILQIEVFFKVCSFINLSYFLKTGKYPLLLDRVLGLKQVYARDVERTFGSKYLARELLWNGFIEILVFIIPLVNYHKFKRVFMKIFRGKQSRSSVSDDVDFTVDTMCTHCGMSPIMPYKMNCPHIFCYACLKGNQVADSHYECPVCQSPNVSAVCQRVTVAGN